MIGEAGSISTLVNTERLQRDPVNGASGRREEEGESGQGQGASDSVSLSPEAIALARNVPPAGEASEDGDSTESERQAETAESSRRGGIDIRV